MLAWSDYFGDTFGSNLSDSIEIENAKSKDDLARIIDERSEKYECMESEAQASLRDFRQKLGI